MAHLRPETIQRAFFLWGELNKEYRSCRDSQVKAMLKERRKGIISLVNRVAVEGGCRFTPYNGDLRPVGQ